MFDSDSKPKQYDFGWWPEIFGCALALGIIWYLFHFADGVI